jgi:nucleoside-diphosphate-sugar epimerase
MKRVIVTGASGFVGANLARRLLNDGHKVHLLLRREYNTWRIESIQEHMQVHVVDLEDLERVSVTVRNIRPDWVFHLAAYGAYPSQTDLARMIQTNIVGSTNLVNACLATGFEAFINTGSSSEYGFKDHAPLESEALEPNSHYAVTKASATLFCRFTAKVHQVRMPTLRLYSVYGPYEEPSRLIPSLVTSGLQGQLPPLVNPDVARDYVCVDDVIEAYLLAATHSSAEPGAIYNVGTGIQTSLRQVIEIARRVMGITAQPAWNSMPNRQWDTDVWIADNAKIRDELRWQPRFNFEGGLHETVAWFQAHPQLLKFYEQEKVLPTVDARL